MSGKIGPIALDGDDAVKEKMDRIKHKIIVLSGKGGVGKSTVAVNTAITLAGEGKKVGLLDIDIHGPSIPTLLGLEGTPLQGSETTINPIMYGTNLKVMSIGFMLANTDDAVIWRGPMKHTMIKQFITDVDWGDLDYLVVDSPPGTGDEPLSVAKLLTGAEGAVVVTTPQKVSLADVRKSINFCRKVDLPVLGVIENMSGFVCPHCGEVSDIFKSGAGKTMAEEMKIPFLGKVPIEPEIVESCDSGKPFVTFYPESKTTSAIKEIVAKLVGEIEQ